jgi:hypothetical protein
MVRTTFVLAMLMMVATPSLAQDPKRGGTSQQQQVCAKDVSRYCRKVIDADDAAIFGCLKENRAKLSRACLKSLGGDRG